MSTQWKLSRHHQMADGAVVQDVRGPGWYTNLEMGKTAAARDAEQIHAEIGPMNWVEVEFDPVTLVWAVRKDHWYTLTQLEA